MSKTIGFSIMPCSDDDFPKRRQKFETYIQLLLISVVLGPHCVIRKFQRLQAIFITVSVPTKTSISYFDDKRTKKIYLAIYC